MKLQPLNVFKGTIKRIRRRASGAEIVMDVGGCEIVSRVTTAMLPALKLGKGTAACAVIPASDVAIWPVD